MPDAVRVIDSHAELAGIGPNDHHTREHDHSAAGDGTTLAPSTITMPFTFGTPKRIFTVQPSTAGKGPFVLEYGGATFNGTPDPVMYFGYNVRSGGSLILAGENGFSLQLEADYNDGTSRLMEFYPEYHSADNATIIRPWMVTANRVTHSIVVDFHLGPTAGGYVSFDGGDPSLGQFLKLQYGQLQVMRNIAWEWPTAGAKPLLVIRNVAGSGSVTALGLETGEILVLGGATGGTLLTSTLVNTPLSWKAPGSAGWQVGGEARGGANADGSGIDFSFTSNGLIGGRIRAGRWSSVDSGIELRSRNSGGSDRAYLHLNGAGDSFLLATSAFIRIEGNATGLGFFGVTPVARPSAYTQTYATATKTHSNPTSATLTDSTTGTPDTTVADVGLIFSQATLNNNFADLIAQINALRNDVINVKGVLNSVVDDHQALGLLQ